MVHHNEVPVIEQTDKIANDFQQTEQLDISNNYLEHYAYNKAREAKYVQTTHDVVSSLLML